MEANERGRIIVRTSIIGIIVNVVLVVFKMALGVLTNSIAIVLDAINNLSDAFSSVITIVGTKLSGKRPDKKHPMGYGRIEYLSSMIVSAIVIYAGITSCVESVKKIINPELPNYSTVSIVILAVAVVIKLALGIHVKNTGVKIESTALEASGTEAKMDAIVSLSVLVSALVYVLIHISLEAYVGLIIAILIVKSGIELLIDTINDVLGKRMDPELSKQIKSIIREEPEVLGAFDLYVNNYGQGKDIASVHIEIPDTMTSSEIDALSRKIQEKVYEQTGIILVAVGVYSYNTKDERLVTMRGAVAQHIIAFDWALQVHGFYVDDERRQIRFDTVVKFGKDPAEAFNEIKACVEELYPGYTAAPAIDIDISD